MCDAGVPLIAMQMLTMTLSATTASTLIMMNPQGMGAHSLRESGTGKRLTMDGLLQSLLTRHVMMCSSNFYTSIHLYVS